MVPGWLILALLGSGNELDVEKIRQQVIEDLGKRYCTVTMLNTVKDDRGFTAEKDKQYMQAVGVGSKVHAISKIGFEALKVEEKDIQSDCKLPDFVPFDQTESVLFTNVDIFASPDFKGKPACSFEVGAMVEGYFSFYAEDKRYSTISQIPHMKEKCGIDKGYSRQIMYTGKLIKKDVPKPSRFRKRT